jgi:hypothetical protein
MDWHQWHERYADPSSELSQRLEIVRDQVRAALDACPPGLVRVISACAGQGDDLLGVLRDHPRRNDVAARLIELDERNAGVARAAAAAAGLGAVQVIVADAGPTNHYRGMAPADIVLLCGVFGNISDEDIERTVSIYCAQLCKPGGKVIWTRHRRDPDMVPKICQWFEASDFAGVWLSEHGLDFGVGVHRYTGKPRELELGGNMFTFVPSRQ